MRGVSKVREVGEKGVDRCMHERGREVGEKGVNRCMHARGRSAVALHLRGVDGQGAERRRPRHLLQGQE